MVRFLHHHEIVILQLRAFLAVIEEGSLHRAATRLSLSHSALSRQMQALERELGGKLLERSSTGVQPTAGGYALATKTAALLASYDSTMVEVRHLVRGETEQLRIGYLASAFGEYLAPALEKVRQVHPRTKVKLLDLFPGEQITALRQGEIDIALTQEIGDLLGRDFYTRQLAVTESVVALPAGHPLGLRKQVKIAGAQFHRSAANCRRLCLGDKDRGLARELRLHDGRRPAPGAGRDQATTNWVPCFGF